MEYSSKQVFSLQITNTCRWEIYTGMFKSNAYIYVWFEKWVSQGTVILISFFCHSSTHGLTWHMKRNSGVIGHLWQMAALVLRGSVGSDACFSQKLSLLRCSDSKCARSAHVCTYSHPVFHPRVALEKEWKMLKYWNLFWIVDSAYLPFEY